MQEPSYIVSSDSKTTGKEKSFTFSEMTIEIDLGTSQCRVVVWSGSRVELLNNTRKENIRKSYVTFKCDDPYAGYISPEDEMFSGSMIFNIKHLIGIIDTDPVVQACKNLPFQVQTMDIGVWPLIGVLVNFTWKMTTPEVLGKFLVELRAMIEDQLKRRIRYVVLTVPVSFSRFQTTRIQHACASSDFHICRLMPKPTVAAVLYAQQQQQQNRHVYMDSRSDKIALIFNMGAGYSDVAVALLAKGISQFKALTGSTIGGEDLLQNMMRHLFLESENLLKSHEVSEIKWMGRLRLAIQDVIHKLSSQDIVVLDVDLEEDVNICKLVHRLEFEEVNKHVFQKCESLIIQCLKEAKVEVQDLNDVIIVSGCSCIPRVKSLVANICRGKEFYEGMNPLEAAVRGATLAGAVASGVKDFVRMGNLNLFTIQSTPLAIGIRANAEENQLLGYFKIMNIPAEPKGILEIHVCMDINVKNELRVYTGVRKEDSYKHLIFDTEVRMPLGDDGHGWCPVALNRRYGATLDLVTVMKKAY